MSEFIFAGYGTADKNAEHFIVDGNLAKFPKVTLESRAIGCNFDSAGSMLQHLYENLFHLPAESAVHDGSDLGTFIQFDLKEFIEFGYNLQSVAMNEVGYVYVQITLLSVIFFVNRVALALLDHVSVSVVQKNCDLAKFFHEEHGIVIPVFS